MNPGDDIYLGGILAGGLNIVSQTTDAVGDTVSPVLNQGVGPAGRVFFHNIQPLTKQAASVAILQAPSSGQALTLTAGTGVTKGTSPDGQGNSVYQFDVPRCVSLTSVSNLSAINFTVVGYDYLGRLTSQVLAGPSGSTVNTLKSMLSVLSVTPNGSNAGTVSVGSADIFGLPWMIADAGYIVRAGWANALANDAGTFVAADQTNPATTGTGDPRGTYAPSSGSNGTNRLVIGVHLIGNQCGPQARLANVIGVTPV